MKIIAHCIVLLTILTLSIKPAYAKKITHHKPVTLQQYIDKLCKKDCVDSNKLKHFVTHASHKHKVPKRLILAVVKVESRFSKKAYSKGNYGLMQINASSHPDIKVKYDVDKNIDAGTGILKDCLNKTHGVIKNALTCYKGAENPIYLSEVLTALSVIKTFQI